MYMIRFAITNLAKSEVSQTPASNHPHDQRPRSRKTVGVQKKLKWRRGRGGFEEEKQGGKVIASFTFLQQNPPPPPPHHPHHYLPLGHNFEFTSKKCRAGRLPLCTDHTFLCKDCSFSLIFASSGLKSDLQETSQFPKFNNRTCKLLYLTHF